MYFSVHCLCDDFAVRLYYCKTAFVVVKFSSKGGYMQVPAVCASGFPVADAGTYKIDKQSTSYLVTDFGFANMPAVCFDSKSDMNDITQWKCFCQEQILADNIDYIA